MRVIISGGGTGGHIYPAVTIAKTLSELVQPCDILFVGTNHGLEADIIPKEGFAFKTIEVRGFERRLSLKNIKTMVTTAGSVWESFKIIREFRPDVAIGTGGYVCGPILLAASLMGIPTLIQEQNVIPGITNKILARFVNKIAVGYAQAGRHFAKPEKIVATGNPIRAEVMSQSRDGGIKEFGLDPDKFTVLAAGGSQGAHTINQAMLMVDKHFAGSDIIQVLHVTGQNEYNDIVGIFMHNGIDVAKCGNIIIKPYLYNMPQALAVADLAIFRAGAIGLAELTARGIASVLIPYPYAAENHQEHNARAVADQGAAIVIRDAELAGEKLIAIIEDLANDPQKLQAMRQASKQLGRPSAAHDIAEIVISLVKFRK